MKWFSICNVQCTITSYKLCGVPFNGYQNLSLLETIGCCIGENKARNLKCLNTISSLNSNVVQNVILYKLLLTLHYYYRFDNKYLNTFSIWRGTGSHMRSWGFYMLQWFWRFRLLNFPFVYFKSLLLLLINGDMQHYSWLQIVTVI